MLHIEESRNGQVIQLRREGPYSLEAARSILPLVIRITERWYRETSDLREQFERSQGQEQRREIEQQFKRVLTAWSHQINALGAETKGPWLVDFDTGDGRYWCWRYPETELNYVHAREEGFAGRKLIGDLPS